ncbi:MAG: GNAT family N-acetyltransferase [Calditrichia bacterium]|jgi:ribosomal protein S18 acetylase RimI-like enzyme
MVKIRKMIPQDRGKIYEILQQTHMFTMGEISVAMELIDTYLFNKEQNDYHIYIATENKDDLAGYVCFGPTPAAEGTFDLYWIAVAPALQNKGFGKILLQYVESEIYRKGGRLIIIETSSQTKYNPTQQFYLNNQYHLEARIKDFYRPGDDKLIFTKNLTLNSKYGKRENGKVAENLAR